MENIFAKQFNQIYAKYIYCMYMVSMLFIWKSYRFKIAVYYVIYAFLLKAAFKSTKWNLNSISISCMKIWETKVDLLSQL